MAEFIYQMIKARKAHGDKVILDDVTLAFLPGAKIGVVGPNGSGKSSVLKIMAGLDTPSNGEARLSEGFSVGILMQEPKLNEDKTVLGNVEEAVFETKAKLDRFNEISAELANPEADYDKLLEEMGVLQEQIDHLDAWDLDSQLEQAMDALRCPPGDTPVHNLSGGEKRRVALCKLLLEKPDLLLLDEPSLGLAPQMVEKVFDLIASLRKEGLTILLVEQNVPMSLEIADRGIVLANGRIVAPGTPDEVRHSEDPLVHQFVHALPDGPVRFHHPGPSLAEDFGATSGRGGSA
jgi:ATPase subunit of ABC transporter with duplicated ATPase domains